MAGRNGRRARTSVGRRVPEIGRCEPTSRSRSGAHHDSRMPRRCARLRQCTLSGSIAKPRSVHVFALASSSTTKLNHANRLNSVTPHPEARAAIIEAIRGIVCFTFRRYSKGRERNRTFFNMIRTCSAALLIRLSGTSGTSHSDASASATPAKSSDRSQRDASLSQAFTWSGPRGVASR